jgi:hypothetical protein
VVGIEMGRASAVMVVGTQGLRARDVLWHLTRKLPVMCRLVGRELVLGAWAALPFAAAIGVIAWLVLRGMDKNYLIHEKPPRFWWGLAGAGAAGGRARLHDRAARDAVDHRGAPLRARESHGGRGSSRERAEMKGRLREVFVHRSGVAGTGVARGLRHGGSACVGRASGSRV